MGKSGKSRRESGARSGRPVQTTFLKREPAPLPTALIDLNYSLLRDALPRLLEDKSTGRNIVWATDSYAHLGPEFAPDAPITIEALDKLGDEFRPRVLKRDDERRKRSKERAEVFTPARICAMMNDFCDQDWFGRKTPIFTKTTEDGWETVEGKILFPKKRNWRQYVDSRRLEITCGEAPFIVSRYDAATGDYFPVKEERRAGALDRKLRIIAENTVDLSEDEWLKVALRAFQSVYGYEYQGDSLLIARINVLMSLFEYHRDRFEDRDESIASKDIAKFANVIAWNFWQMDGLTCKNPVRAQTKLKEIKPAQRCFDSMTVPDIGTDYFYSLLPGENDSQDDEPQTRVYNWRTKPSYPFIDLMKGNRPLKFDYIIGNPPYQEEVDGNTRTRPVYNFFMNASYKVGNKVLLITPGRFLYNAGFTPADWNKEMLSDVHLKVLLYEPDSSIIFRDVEIKGGVAITYRNAEELLGPIDVFFAYKELKNIYVKTVKKASFIPLSDSVYSYNQWDLEELYDDHPEFKSLINAGGNDRKLITSVFTQIPIFTATGGVTIIGFSV